MLDSAKLVGFVPTKDYEQARAFYVGKLGFDFVSLDQFALVVRIGGHMIRIVKLPEFTPLQATILGWEVSDIATVASWLQDARCWNGEISVRSGSRTRHLDRAERR